MVIGDPDHEKLTIIFVFIHLELIPSTFLHVACELPLPLI